MTKESAMTTDPTKEEAQAVLMATFLAWGRKAIQNLRYHAEKKTPVIFSGRYFTDGKGGA